MTPDAPPPPAFEPRPPERAPEAARASAPGSARPARPDVRADADHPLLDHLDALYGFAQLVTPDADAAARLVRATYARAFAEPTLPPPPEHKPWLFGLLLDERREHRAPHPLPAPADAHERPDDLGESRQRLGEALVLRLLPTALLSLSTRQRLILALCDVEGLSCAAAGEVLGLEPAVACGQHAAARDALAESLRAAAAPHEHALLERALADGGLQRAVASAYVSELAPTPPTLRPTIPVPEPPRAPVPNTERHARAGWGKFAYAAGLIVGAGLLGFFVTRRAPDAEATNLVALAARNAPSAQIMLRTSDAAQAEAFALDHAGWRIDLPAIRGLTLQGTGLAEVAEGVSVPVFLYASNAARGRPAEQVTVYAFTYRLLDQARALVSLEPDVRDALNDDRHYDLHDTGDAKAILWRDRDDVFVAVTQGNAESVSRRIDR